MTDLTAAADFDTPSAPLLAPSATSHYDRSIVEGPLGSAVWKIAWPSMLTNIIGGAQGIIDQCWLATSSASTATPPASSSPSR